MKNKKTLFTSVILVLSLWGNSALAASFDFANIADTFASAGGSGESAWTSFKWTDDGITLTATARNLANASPYYAYMDAGNAGMGVCKSLMGGAIPNVGRDSKSNLCSPASDDNLTLGEVLVWEFSEEVSLDLELVNGSHGTNFIGNFGVYVGAGDPTLFTDFSQIALSATVSNPLLTGKRFQFISNATISGIENNQRQLYLSAVNATPTPEPSTVVLLGSGLAGMAAWQLRRQAKKNQQVS